MARISPSGATRKFPVGGRRRVAAQPADGGADHRLGHLLVGVEALLPVAELAPPAGIRRHGLHHDVEAQGLRIGAGDLAQDRPLLPRHLLGVAVVGRRQDHLGARLEARELLHHEEGVVEPARVLFEPERLGHGHRRAVEGAVGAELDGALGLDQAAGRIPAQDEPARARLAALAPVQHEAVGLAGGAAEDPREVLDAHAVRGGELRLDVAGESLLEGGHRASALSPDPAAASPAGGP
jgi:hypothetical protein